MTTCSGLNWLGTGSVGSPDIADIGILSSESQLWHILFISVYSYRSKLILFHKSTHCNSLVPFCSGEAFMVIVSEWLTLRKIQ
jgi:hypothetical protein